MLEFSLKMISRHVTDVTPLVFDNSSTPEARKKIQSVCQGQNVSYLALPENPTRHPNRSHGMAMTWIWRNVLRALRPKIFGFIDHDVVPLKQVEATMLLKDQPFYGVPNVGKWGWSLWAGFCFYDFSEVMSRPLNFLNDFSRGMDTGGRNWECLYSKHDHRKMRFADWQLFEVVAGGAPRQIEIIDESWIHLAGVSYRDDYRKNLDFYRPILQKIEEGANWQQLQASFGNDNIRPTGQETIAKSNRPRWRKSRFIANMPAPPPRKTA